MQGHESGCIKEGFFSVSKHKIILFMLHEYYGYATVTWQIRHDKAVLCLVSTFNISDSCIV